MTEVTLTAAQQLRLEALNQASLSLAAHMNGAPIKEVLIRAKAFAEFIEKGEVPADKSKQ